MPTSLNVLYEDNHLLVVSKRAGELVQGDKTGDTPLVEHGKRYLKEKYGKPGDVFLGVVHRIDRPVSGVVVFARTSKALDRMNKLFREKNIRKTYWAICRNKPKKIENTLVHWLRKNPRTNTTKAFKTEKQGSLRSELHYKVIAELNGLVLLQVNPLTGRPHQIRVQLASIGCQIVGDVRYGYPQPNADASICLHAYSLNFIHPVKKQNIILFAPLPQNQFWKVFSKIESASNELPD